MTPLFTDVHIHDGVVEGLLRRGITILTAIQDGSRRADDPDLLDRAMELNCILITQDKDFLIESAKRQREGRAFAAIVFSEQTIPIGRMIDDLEIIAHCLLPEERRNRVYRLPL